MSGKVSAIRQNMKDRRKELGYTQKQLADEIGVKRSTIAAIECGNMTPSLSVAVKIKQVLQYEKDDIFFVRNVS